MTVLRISDRPRLVVDEGPVLRIGGSTTINVDGDVTVVEPGAGGGGSPSGGAGGALSGSYPNPGLNVEVVQDLVGAMAGRGLRYVDADGELVADVSEFDVVVRVADQSAIADFAPLAAGLPTGTTFVLWWTAAGSVVAWEYVKDGGGLTAVAQLEAPRWVTGANSIDVSAGLAPALGPFARLLRAAETWLGGDGAVSWFDPAASDISGLGDAATKNVGTTAGTVAAGDDSRLSDARTPTAHKSSHATGGSDALTASDIGAASSSHNHDSAYQPLDPDLTSIAALSTTSFGRGLLTEASASTLRATAGVGATTRPIIKLTGYTYAQTYEGVSLHGGLWNGQACTLAANQMVIAPAAVRGTVERLAMYVTSATAGSGDSIYIVCYSAAADGSPDALLWSESTTIGSLSLPTRWVKSGLSREIPDGAWLGFKNGSGTGNVVGRAVAWALGGGVMVDPASPAYGVTGFRTTSYSGAPPANVTSAATWTNADNFLPIIVGRAA